MRGTLSFDDPAYGMTRTILNGMLRQADALSLPHIVRMMLTRFWWSSARVEHRFDAQFDRAQAQLTDEGRAAIRKIMDQAHVAIVSHMLHISFTLGPVVQALKLWYAWRATRATTTRASADLAALIVRASNTRNSMHQSLGTLDASAHLVGDLDTAPGLLRAV
jgi:hypothetical protein